MMILRGFQWAQALRKNCKGDGWSVRSGHLILKNTTDVGTPETPVAWSIGRFRTRFVVDPKTLDPLLTEVFDAQERDQRRLLAYKAAEKKRRTDMVKELLARRKNPQL